MSFKIEVVEDECIGCGACAAACSDVFEMDGDKAKAKQTEIEEVGCAQEAAESCPVTCIKVTEIK
jgi:ferredoxin